MPQDIVEARPLDGHRLLLTFDDGASGTIDLGAMIRLDGVFAALRDADCFARVRVDREPGTVVRPNGADMCPDELHARSTGQKDARKELYRRHPCCH